MIDLKVGDYVRRKMLCDCYSCSTRKNNIYIINSVSKHEAWIQLVDSESYDIVIFEELIKVRGYNTPLWKTLHGDK